MIARWGPGLWLLDRVAARDRRYAPPRWVAQLDALDELAVAA